MIVLSLFDGISCGRVALERANIKVDKYYASEIKKEAIKITMKNYPDTIQLGDVATWKEWDIPWDKIDLLIGGSPCQSLSIIQSKIRKNLYGKSGLFFYFVDILNYIKKFNPNIKFLFENVASMNNESKRIIEDSLGVPLVLQNSDAFSAQKRPRYYGTNFKWEVIKEPCNVFLKDIMESNVDEKYFYKQSYKFLGNKSVCAILDINGHDIIKRVYNPNFKCHTLTTCSGGNTQSKVMDNERVRKLTPLEYERLQTLPDNYTDGICDTSRYTVIGNGWNVNTVAHIFKGLNNNDN